MRDRSTTAAPPLGALLVALLLALAVLAPPPAQAGTNHEPVARDNAYSLNEDEVLSVGKYAGVISNDRDRDGDRLFAKLTRATHDGAISLAKSGALSYDPNENYNGGDFASYRACEVAHPKVCSEIRTIRFSVAPVNDAPVANGNHFYLRQGHEKTWAAPSVLGNDTDVDGDELAVKGHTGSSPKVRVWLNEGGSLKIWAAKDTKGRYSFEYTATDPGGLTDTATATIRVRAR